ncbi:hypothetical protein [Azotobacter armeniacus]
MLVVQRLERLVPIIANQRRSQLADQLAQRATVGLGQLEALAGLIEEEDELAIPRAVLVEQRLELAAPALLAERQRRLPGGEQLALLLDPADQAVEFLLGPR